MLDIFIINNSNYMNPMVLCSRPHGSEQNYGEVGVMWPYSDRSRGHPPQRANPDRCSCECVIPSVIVFTSRCSPGTQHRGAALAPNIAVQPLHLTSRCGGCVPGTSRCWGCVLGTASWCGGCAPHNIV